LRDRSTSKKKEKAFAFVLLLFFFSLTFVFRLVKRKITGLNIDFEPTSAATPQDAADYAKFLDDFAGELHKHGKKLTVAIASWNAIWNWTLLAQTKVDKLMIMSTYTGNWTLFEKFINQGVQQIGLEKLVGDMVQVCRKFQSLLFYLLLLLGCWLGKHQSKHQSTVHTVRDGRPLPSDSQTQHQGNRHLALPNSRNPSELVAIY
jgi:hypothetical protein